MPENPLSSLLNNINDLPAVDPTMEHSVVVRSKSGTLSPMLFSFIGKRWTENSVDLGLKALNHVIDVNTTVDAVDASVVSPIENHLLLMVVLSTLIMLSWLNQ